MTVPKPTKILEQIIDRKTFLKFLQGEHAHIAVRDDILYGLATPLTDAATDRTVRELGVRPPSEDELEVLGDLAMERLEDRAQEAEIARLNEQEHFFVKLKPGIVKQLRGGNHPKNLRLDLVDRYLQNQEPVERFISGAMDIVLENYREYLRWRDQDMGNKRRPVDPRKHLYDRLANYIDAHAQLFAEAKVDLKAVHEVVTEMVEGAIEFWEERSEVRPPFKPEGGGHNRR